MCEVRESDAIYASLVPYIHKFDLQNYSTDFEEIWYSLVVITCYVRGEKTG